MKDEGRVELKGRRGKTEKRIGRKRRSLRYSVIEI